MPAHSPRSPKTIFFDAVGTLLFLPRGVGFHYREVALRHGWDIEESRLNAEFRAVWRQMPPRGRIAGPRQDDDRGWWRELVNRVLDRCGAGRECDREAYFRDLYDEFTKPGVWRLFPEASDVLKQLASHFTLGVISNFDGRLRVILGQLQIVHLFAHLIISSEVGADKPARQIFERALRIAGIQPEDAMHVGDDPLLDWQGARSAGMQVLQLARPKDNLSALLALLPRA